ncbi:MAG: glycosyltransferase family 1 protein [Balneolaceae bacterium]|nr:MAG: glycosyltransferase family 1 protein [Balneolaceae bacterium]
MSSTIKVLFCAHDRPDYINGPNIWLRRLLPGLRERNMEGIVLFFPSGDPDRCETIRALRDDGFTCEVYRGRNYTEFRMRWIADMAKRHNPDVFVPNLDIPAYYASAWIRQAGIPTVGVLHSDDPFYRAIVDDFLRKPDPSPLSAVVCVSQFLEELCREAGAGKTDVRRIPYGVPVPEARARYRQQPFRLVYAGRLVEPQKRISDVAHALCRLTQEVAGTEAVLYGSGPSENQVRDIINRAGCTEKVRLGGLLGSGELLQQYNDAQVFVLLSDFEGLPIALMEAMACGLVPVCHAMRSGIPELLNDGVNGITVPDRGDGFIDAVRRLMESPDTWQRLSDAARAKVEQNYSVRSSTEKWAALLSDLAKGGLPKGRPVLPGELKLPHRHEAISEYQDKRWPGFYRYYRNRAGSVLKKLNARIP